MSAIVECEIFQKGELYISNVHTHIDGEEVSLGTIKSDKIRIQYNTKNKQFTVIFVYGALRLVECSVDYIYAYNITKDNKISLPSYDAEWPYDNIHIDMLEE